MSSNNGQNSLTPELIQHEIQRRASAMAAENDTGSENSQLEASRQVFEELLERLAERMEQGRKIA